MRIFIGVAWPYANGVVHLGHIAGAILPADIFARFHRMLGNEVLMVSGSDEHGTPITITAEKEGVSPQEIVDRYHRINSEIFERLGITFDLYFRTSHPRHHEVVREMFLRLLEKGYLYEKVTLGTYCPRCDRFLPDRYVEGECPHCGNPSARGDQCDSCGKTLDPTDLIEPRCKVCGSPASFRETKHFFFRLSAFEERLREWLGDKNYWRPNVLKFTRNYVEGGLQDRPITRDISWGVRVPVDDPEYEGKRIYVWFDAVTGYLSASREYSRVRGEEDYWQKFWKDPEARHYYFLGKDNIPFHTIIWPAMLMGYGDLNLPYDVPANEYLRFRGVQFSKSRGIGVWMDDMLERFPPDVIRFYASLAMPERHDTDFTWEDFAEKVNSALINTFGNYVHRVLTFVHRVTGKWGQLKYVEPSHELDREAYERIRETSHRMKELLERVELKKALNVWLDLARYANVYFDRRRPWVLIKEDEAACREALSTSVMILKALTVLGYPYIPHTCERLSNDLGLNLRFRWEEAMEPFEAVRLDSRPQPLFRKVEVETGPWSKLDLRVARITAVEDHPRADRLYVLKVNLGDEERTLVAGLKGIYAKEELEGRRVVVLANLEPARLRGVESRGMLLAGDDGENVGVLVPDGEVEAGAHVDAGDLPSRPEGRVKLKDFERVSLRVGKILETGEVTRVDVGEVMDIPQRSPPEWKGKLCVVVMGDSPAILHVGDVLIMPLREVNPGGRVR